MSKPITKEAAREALLENVRALARYWAKQPGTSQDQCDGVAFSILVLLDGHSGMPSMDLVLRPHPDDKDFRKGKGEDWYEDGMVINDDVTLHDLYHQR